MQRRTRVYRSLQGTFSLQTSCESVECVYKVIRRSFLNRTNLFHVEMGYTMVEMKEKKDEIMVSEFQEEKLLSRTSKSSDGTVGPARELCGSYEVSPVGEVD